MLSTIGNVELNVMFGPYSYIGSFEVLDCEVPLILGMSFLAKVAPRIDFNAKSVCVQHGGK